MARRKILPVFMVIFLLLALPLSFAASYTLTDNPDSDSATSYGLFKQNTGVSGGLMSAFFFQQQAIFDGIDYDCSTPRKHQSFSQINSLNIVHPSNSGLAYTRIELWNSAGSQVSGGFIKNGATFVVNNLNPSLAYEFYSFSCYPKNQQQSCTKTGSSVSVNGQVVATDKCASLLSIQGYNVAYFCKGTSGTSVETLKAAGYVLLGSSTAQYDAYGGGTCQISSCTKKFCPDGTEQVSDSKCTYLPCAPICAKENEPVNTAGCCAGLIEQPVFLSPYPKCVKPSDSGGSSSSSGGSGSDSGGSTGSGGSSSSGGCIQEGGTNFIGGQNCCEGLIDFPANSYISSTCIKKCSIPSGSQCDLVQNIPGTTDDTQPSNQCKSGICYDTGGFTDEGLGQCYSQDTYTYKSGIVITKNVDCFEEEVSPSELAQNSKARQKTIPIESVRTKTSKELLDSLCNHGDMCESNAECKNFQSLIDEGYLTDSSAKSSIKESKNLILGNVNIGTASGAAVALKYGVTICKFTGAASVYAIPICLAILTASGGVIGGGVSEVFGGFIEDLDTQDTKSVGYCVEKKSSDFSLTRLTSSLGRVINGNLGGGLGEDSAVGIVVLVVLAIIFFAVVFKK